jgi:hypothetical protein
MATNRSDKVKLYVVIGLAFVAAFVAYFRFIHKGDETGTDIVSPGPEETKFDVSQIEKTKPRGAKVPRLTVADSASTYIRDIFAPVQLPEDSEGLIGAGETSGRSGVLKLKGTIMGGKTPIAIINDRFLGMGERIGEYQIVRIDPNEVLLRSGSHDKVLEVVTSERLLMNN